MPFSPNQLDSIVLIDSRWIEKSVSRDDLFSQLKIIQLQISSNTCQHLNKPKFSCFYDPTSYNADLIDRRINEIKKRECSLRIFCKNEKNETYKRECKTRFYLSLHLLKIQIWSIALKHVKFVKKKEFGFINVNELD